MSILAIKSLNGDVPIYFSHPYTGPEDSAGKVAGWHFEFIHFVVSDGHISSCHIQAFYAVSEAFLILVSVPEQPLPAFRR